MRCTVGTRQDMQVLAMQGCVQEMQPCVALSATAVCTNGGRQGVAVLLASRSALLHGLQICCHQHAQQGGLNPQPHQSGCG